MKTILNYRLSICIILYSVYSITSVQSQLTAVTGSYMGDGTTNRYIFGLGFKPDMVFIKCNLFYSQITTSTMPTNKTKDMNGGAPDPDVIISLEADGFTIGNDVKVNQNNTVYNYLAVKAEPGVIEFGSYTGNSMDNRNIDGITFSPNMVIIISENNNEKPLFSSTSMPSDQSMNFLNSVTVDDQIQAFNSNGFQVGKDKAVNVTGLKYHYIAMKHIPGKIFIGSYVGNGANNRVITEPGKGSFTMVKMYGQHAIFRMWDMPVNNAHYFKNSASVDERIKEQTKDGFKLGTNNEVNQSGNVYYYMQILGMNNVLPISLVAFDARLIEKKISLDWKTSSEQNSAFFEVQRSKNSTDFETISLQPSIGNSSMLVSYHYLDNNPFSGYSYYRLKLVDIDGRFKYSDVRKILYRKDSLTDFLFYPNPFFGNQLKLDYTGNEPRIYLTIYNIDGEKVDSKVLLNGKREFEMKNHLQPGIYFIVGDNGHNVIFKNNVVKL